MNEKSKALSLEDAKNYSIALNLFDSSHKSKVKLLLEEISEKHPDFIAVLSSKIAQKLRGCEDRIK